MIRSRKWNCASLKMLFEVATNSSAGSSRGRPDAFGDQVETVVQEEQRGTGHAVQVAMDAALSDFAGRVVILYGDCPLMDPPHVEALLAAANEGSGDAAQAC